MRNLASCNAGQMILMDLELELRAMDQARFTTDGVYFDSVENRLDEPQLPGATGRTRGRTL